MTACFHLPSVVCENCAHLRSNSARPETRTFVTNHLIVAPDSGPTKASSGYVAVAHTDERLDEIKTKWNIPVTLPMSVPWGKDDVVWLVGEVERLRAEAKRADEEATKLANSDLATTEQVVRALTDEIKRLRGALDTVMDACDAECAACGAYYVAKKALDGVKGEKP